MKKKTLSDFIGTAAIALITTAGQQAIKGGNYNNSDFIVDDDVDGV